MTESELSRPATRPPPGRRAIFIRAAKWLIAVAVVVGLYLAAQSALLQWKEETGKVDQRILEIDQRLAQIESGREFERLQQEREHLQATVPRLVNLHWSRIALAGLLYALGLLPPSMLLHRALVSLGQHPRLGTTVAAQTLGHVGKYVPGKAMVIVLRAGALSRDGVRPLAATVSVFLETFLMMAVGAAVAGVVVLWLPVPKWISFGADCVAVLASLPTFPPIMKRVAARVSKVSLTEVKSNIGFGLFAAGWGWSLLSWALIGASFTCLITAIPSPAPPSSLLQLYAIATAAISLAIVIGFASLLPGGAGVRELVLTTVLGVSIGAVHGLLAAIAARILFMVVEVIVAGISWAFLKYTR